jgi:uncharacterized membrane protein YphA (DoxX/SURF4 family)
MLSAVFIGQGIETLLRPATSADAAQTTVDALRTLPEPVGSKVPSDAETAARINAAVQVGGGILLATGKLPRIASAALACTVIPGSLGAHTFWNESDPQLKAEKRRNFLSDLSLLGGLIIASADTEGRPSLGWRSRQAAGRISGAVSAALPLASSDGGLFDGDLDQLGEKISQRLQAGAERGRELVGAAEEKSAPLLDTARERGAELAQKTRRGAKLAQTARGRGAELADTARDVADTARDRGADLAETARKRAAEVADTARDRGTDLADIARKRARKQVEQTRKELKKEVKRARKEVERAREH